MAKLNWNRSSGRGYGCGGGGYYHYGKTSGPERTLMGLGVLKFFKAEAPDGQTACLIECEKVDGTRYRLAAENKLGDTVLKHIRIGQGISAVVKPTGRRTLIIRDIIFGGGGQRR